MNIYIPSKITAEDALARTDILCIAAHQDDIELMAASLISDCYKKKDKWFTGMVMTDGASSPRSGRFADYTNEQMIKQREEEQIKAADIGDYSAVCLCGFTSEDVKQKSMHVLAAMKDIIERTCPETVIIHNLADKHETHVACSLCAITALKSVDAKFRPKKVYMAEVWRSLDWLCDDEKVILPNQNKELTLNLLNCFESQVVGGKRYDEAFVGRQKANATFFQSHFVDSNEGCSYAIDATELITSDISAGEFIANKINKFYTEVRATLKKFDS